MAAQRRRGPPAALPGPCCAHQVVAREAQGLQRLPADLRGGSTSRRGRVRGSCAIQSFVQHAPCQTRPPGAPPRPPAAAGRGAHPGSPCPGAPMPTWHTFSPVGWPCTPSSTTGPAGAALAGRPAAEGLAGGAGGANLMGPYSPSMPRVSGAGGTVEVLRGSAGGKRVCPCTSSLGAVRVVSASKGH